MKYTDGTWRVLSGIKPYYGLQVTEARQTPDNALNLQVVSRVVQHRGDTLGGPVWNVRLHSPIEGVIGVKIDHFRGIKPKTPSIPLFPTLESPPTPPSVNITSTSFTTGELTATITENPYTVTFSAGKHELTKSHLKALSLLDIPSQWTNTSASSTTVLANDYSANPGYSAFSWGAGGQVGADGGGSWHGNGITAGLKRYVNQEVNLAGGELIYGFGEQFTSFIKNGQSVSIWNQDGGTGSKQAYKTVPFYISSRGYGLFVNHPGEVEFEVGSEKASRVGWSVQGESVEWYIIQGTPLEILEKYTLLTGRPSLPPTWTYGLWLSTSFLTDYSSETVSGFLEGMRKRQCDVRVFHMDCFWMKRFEWCSFTFDPDFFPDPKKYITEIKAKYGVKVCLWINPYISQFSPIFDEGVKGNYFITRRNGDVWQWDLWQPGLAIVDFTNPDARKWYEDKLSALLDLGIDCFKTDFGERIPHLNVKYHDDSDPVLMHNFYSVLYNDVVFSLLERRFGKHEAVVFARSSHAGGQRFPVHWGGDCDSTFEGMSETLRGGLSLTLSGFAFTSHDIGGFEGRPAPEIYLRWLAYGLFSSHSRLHGSGSYRVPWEYGEEASKTLAKFLDAKHRLMPYLYYHSIQAHTIGHPLQRATFIDFPGDRTTYLLDQQYMLGPSLLLAPVFGDADHVTSYYLPSSKWTSFWDPSRVIEGPKWVEEKVAYDDVPFFVKEGSILVLGKSGLRKPDWDYSTDVEVQIYELLDGQVAVTSVPTGKGTGIHTVVKAERKGGELVVLLQGEHLKSWSVRLFLPGTKLKSVSGAKEVNSEVGIRVNVEENVKEVVLGLE